MIWKAVLWNVAVQVAGELAFIVVTETAPNTWIDVAAVLLFAAGSVFLIYRSFPGYRILRLLGFSLIAALTWQIVSQLIGFNFYPLFVHSLTPFKSYYFLESARHYCIALVFYMICSACSLLIKWPIEKWLIKK